MSKKLVEGKFLLFKEKDGKKIFDRVGVEEKKEKKKKEKKKKIKKKKSVTKKNMRNRNRRFGWILQRIKD